MGGGGGGRPRCCTELYYLYCDVMYCDVCKVQETGVDMDYFLGRRRRRQAQLARQGEDPFLSKVSGDNREVGG